MDHRLSNDQTWILVSEAVHTDQSIYNINLQRQLFFETLLMWYGDLPICWPDSTRISKCQWFMVCIHAYYSSFHAAVKTKPFQGNGRYKKFLIHLEIVWSQRPINLQFLQFYTLCTHKRLQLIQIPHADPFDSWAFTVPVTIMNPFCLAWLIFLTSYV